MTNEEKCAHWQFTRGCASCEYAPAFVPSELQKLQHKLEEEHMLATSDHCEWDFDGKCQHIHSTNEALATAYQAGCNASVEYILNHEETHRPTSQRIETWQKVLEAARTAQ